MRLTGGESGATALPVDSPIFGGSGSGVRMRPLSGEEGLSMEFSRSDAGAVAGALEGFVEEPPGLVWPVATAAVIARAIARMTRRLENFMIAPLIGRALGCCGNQDKHSAQNKKPAEVYRRCFIF